MEKISRFQSDEEFNGSLIDAIRSRILKKQESGRIFRLALSGGSTPGPIYRSLTQQPNIDWSHIELYLVDERCVPLDDKDSNHRMIRETLIDHLPQPPAKWVFFDTSLPIEECLKKYEAEFNSSDQSFFDLILLGMGIDGHTASLFPNSAALEEEQRWVAYTTTEESIVRDRLTLTYPALESSVEIFFLIKGDEKSEILEQIKESPPKNKELPAARIFHRDGTSLFYYEL